MAGKAAPTVAKTWANTPLATLIDLYILSKQIEGRSAKTLTWYRANLERFARFMNNEVLNVRRRARIRDIPGSLIVSCSTVRIVYNADVMLERVICEAMRAASRCAAYQRPLK